MTLARTNSRSALLTVGLVLAAVAFCTVGCSRKHHTTAPLPARTYAMGFSGIPPKPDLAVTIQAIDLWAQRADWALILTDPPWDSLIAGVSPDTLVRAFQLGLANYYRSKGLRVIASIDPTNGLDRSSDAAPLVAAGRSLTEPAIQQLFRSYVVVLDTLIRPDYLSIASETNLIRGIAPAVLYAAVKQAANDAAADVRAHDGTVRLFSTVQVEVAWGWITGGAYVGVAQDRADFPFNQALGLSSYPYLVGYAEPESIPVTYYSRLVEGAPLPEIVIEGGWSSETVGSNPSTPELQRRYIAHHAQILDEARAIGWFQLTFTDLDLAYFPPAVAPFAYLGLVNTSLQAKPALSAWDAEFRRPRD